LGIAHWNVGAVPKHEDSICPEPKSERREKSMIMDLLVVATELVGIGSRAPTCSGLSPRCKKGLNFRWNLGFNVLGAHGEER
jgi:hypothetical protein